MEEQEDKVVIEEGGRLTGCRGRTLVVLIVLAILLLLLVVMLVRGMFSAFVQHPLPTAAADRPEVELAAVRDDRGGPRL